jgi:hypothetical protein
MRTKRELIRALNDTLRRNHLGGYIVVTAGIQALNADLIRQIGEAVAAYDAFNDANDPHGEHDFGSVTVAGRQVFFKIDYYDQDLCNHSPDPSDPVLTHRVLTIMLAEEY